jgi:hypothetical protein
VRYLDLPATCRVLFEDNGEAASISWLLPAEYPPVFVASYQMKAVPPEIVRAVTYMIHTAETAAVKLPDDFDLDDDAGDRDRDAYEEDRERGAT